MSDAIRTLHDYLAKSPSVVYPQDVLAYLPAIEAENAKLRHDLEEDNNQAEEVCIENAKLRELIVGVHEALCTDKAGIFHKLIIASMEDDMRELGIEAES